MNGQSTPSLSTDLIAAFVQLAALGSLRAAAESLFISEQGLRSRLLALEERLGVELYRKQRGLRRRTPLTEHGQRLLPHARSFLARADELSELFREDSAPQEINVVASQYLIAYVLIGAIQRFHAAYPQIHVRLSARTERELEAALLGSFEYSLGVAAPYESSPDLEYRHLFSMDWSLITPARHPLASRKSVRLRELIRYPLVIYERGSTGRQHVVEAFQQSGLVPHVELEATNTDLIVRMVEAGLGVAVVPLHASGAVTRGRSVKIVSLGRQVRPIHSGVLLRRGEPPNRVTQQLLEFLGSELVGGS
ncbi:MAG: LysR family transcriptional regulator [Pirellulaceae bacterium]|jgi:DNA-binding transcriptional LysR family regulator|nr:LysR family transcriptional regulator [Pirellulaceae bacterium]